MQTNCSQIFGLVFLVFTNLAIVISFATPYWTEENNYVLAYQSNKGLWAECSSQDCTWFFDDEYDLKFFETKTPAWFKAVQVLMSAGLALGLLSLLIATLSLCCSCRSCNPNHPICILLILGGLTMGSAVVVFGIQAKEDWAVHLQWDLDANGRFGWSFWVGVAAAGLSLITGSMYGCMGRRHLD